MINDTVVNKFTHLMNMITENLKIKNGIFSIRFYACGRRLIIKELIKD